MQFMEVYNDDGIFTFSDKGFSIRSSEGLQTIEWSEIISMIAYKEDHYIIDCICLDVFCDNGFSFKITEETSGWYRFIEQSEKALPSIGESWEFEIASPAFKTNLTLVYDRKNRSLKEVTDEFYI